MSIDPYQLEPTRKVRGGRSEHSEGRATRSEDITENNPRIEAKRLSLAANSWCLCENCVTMKSEKECLCCHEVDALSSSKLNNGLSCITLHPGFNPVCLDKYVLWTTLVSLHDRECAWLPDEENVPNRSYRYAAYRQFCYFIYVKLGRFNRRVIPACVMKAIRETFPDPNGKYTGYKSGDFDETQNGESEVAEAWQYVRIEDGDFDI